MLDLQSLLDRSVTTGDLPFVVAIVADRDNVLFSGAAGEAAPGVRASENTLFRFFSMTKAVCTTAAAILIERGRLDPESAIEDIVPDFAGIGILEGYDGAVPRIRPPAIRPTIRHLATHTSGLEYEYWNDGVASYMEKTGHPSILQGTKASMRYPMMTEPGTRWAYGPGVDWLGLAVESVAGRSIVEFCNEEILEPLGMTNTSFEVPTSAASRLAAISLRGDDGDFSPIEIAPPSNPEVYGMGHALYGTAPDYIRLLRMFLNGGELDGRRILSRESVNFMLADQMRGLTFGKMVSSTPLSADFDPFPDTPLTHSFGFLRNEVGIPGMRSAGSQGWAGILNSHYWFDPVQGVAGVFMTQSLPFVESRYMKRFNEFERSVYAQVR